MKRIINTAKKLWFLIKEAFKGFIKDNALQYCAALSFYTIFSLPPLLLIIISLSGVFFGEYAVRGEIFEQIKDLLGSGPALQIQEVLKNVHLSNKSVLASIIGVIVLLIGASSVFSEIQDSLNFIWGIKTKQKKGLIKFVFNRLWSFSMIGSVGFLLLVGLIINSLINILNKAFVYNFSQHTVLLFYVVNTIILFLIVTLLFSIIFKILPDGKISLRDCLAGASFTAFLFMIGKFIIGFYLSSYNIATVYGAAGSVILILAWVYYSAIILYFGAEFTKVYANSYGDKIIPNSYSEKINLTG